MQREPSVHRAGHRQRSRPAALGDGIQPEAFVVGAIGERGRATRTVVTRDAAGARVVVEREQIAASAADAPEASKDAPACVASACGDVTAQCTPAALRRRPSGNNEASFTA